MAELILDHNGIWSEQSAAEIFYPGSGNDNSFQVEDTSFWFAHRNQVIKTVIERFPFRNHYADIGGGNGLQAKFISDHFPDKKVFLIEPGYKGCLNAKTRGVEHVYHTTFENFDFAASGVGGAGLYDVVEHIEDDVAFMKRLKEALPKGSVIYVTVPAHNYLWSDVDDFGHHFRRYDLKMLNRLGETSGLEVLYTSYFFSYLLPLTGLLRSLPYKLRGKRRTEQLLETEDKQHHPGKVTLKIFDLFHRYELRKLGESKIPMGASCIAVFKN